MVRVIARELDDRHIHVKEQRAPAFVPDHALGPEEGGNARTARDWRDVMQRGRRIYDHIAGRQFHAVAAIGVFDHKLTTVIVFRA